MIVELLALGGSLSGTAATAQAAGPEVLHVAAGGSDPTCVTPCATISQAVAQAASDLRGGTASAVTIVVAAGSYNEHPAISVGPITIQGAGPNATYVRGGFSGTVVTVAAGATATITDLTITGGNGENGGGVANRGNLTLQRVTVGFNAASSLGGGIYNTGTVEIDDSAVTADQAQTTGGGIISIGGTVILNRDAIVDNSVLSGTGSGGGVRASSATVAVRDSTISGNTAEAGGGVLSDSAYFQLLGDTISNNRAQHGGGIFADGTTTPLLAGTIVAGNQGGGCQDERNFPMSSMGDNLDDDGSCFSNGPGDLVNVNPRLGQLRDNGGPTQTIAIPVDSPARNGASPMTGTSLCSGTDQRGVSRLQRGATRCDIGAYQVAAPTLYVANPGTDSVTAYPPGANGDSPPTLALAGPLAGLSNPNGIALDTAGDVFVANTNANSITEYAPEVTGNTAPIATITGTLTHLTSPRGLARDGSGHVFVSNGDDSVTEYPANADGNVAPIARIIGRRTRLSFPLGLAIGADGRLRVANDNGTITTYAAGATGNVAPTAVLSSTLQSPQALAFDSSGRLRISDVARNTVYAFASKASGSATPISTLIGTNPPLSAPIGLDVDDGGNLFIANAGTNTVTEYPPAAKGAAPSLATITGPDTGLRVPTFLAELPPAPYPKISIARLQRQTLRRILHAGLRLIIRTRSRLAFRSAPLIIAATVHVGRATLAKGRITITSAGRTILRLVPIARPAHRAHHRMRGVVTLRFHHGSDERTRRLLIHLRP